VIPAYIYMTVLTVFSIQHGNFLSMLNAQFDSMAQ
jgi:hypothetical protein